LDGGALLRGSQPEQQRQMRIMQRASPNPDRIGPKRRSSLDRNPFSPKPTNETTVPTPKMPSPNLKVEHFSKLRRNWMMLRHTTSTCRLWLLAWIVSRRRRRPRNRLFDASAPMSCERCRIVIEDPAPLSRQLPAQGPAAKLRWNPKDPSSLPMLSDAIDTAVINC
jgi:hypothetical protein